MSVAFHHSVNVSRQRFGIIQPAMKNIKTDVINVVVLADTNEMADAVIVCVNPLPVLFFFFKEPGDCRLIVSSFLLSHLSYSISLLICHKLNVFGASDVLALMVIHTTSFALFAPAM